ncbi:g6510 [Coccomyxa elongata]
MSFASWARPEPSPAANLGPQWKVCWRTDKGDHNTDTIASLVYQPSLAGLPSGDGHAGWLISGSPQLLNLWECSASGGRGEESLQLMHQQTTDTTARNLAPEPRTGLLLAAAQDPGRPSCCISLHSLHAESGLFAPRGRMPLPPIDVANVPLPSSHSHSQIESLHSLGGPLTTCCAATFGRLIVIYPTTIAPGEIPKSKAAWMAHTSDVTSLHRSQHGLHLFSGAHDGAIHMWDLKAKPSKPSMSFRHSAAVTGLNHPNDRHLVSCSMDGRLFLWDIRRPVQPLRSMASPDGSGIAKMAVSPFGDSAVCGTIKGGLFSAPVVLDEAAEVTPLPSLPGAVAALTWNTSTGELYAASEATITVLQPVL